MGFRFVRLRVPVTGGTAEHGLHFGLLLLIWCAELALGCWMREE